MPDLRLAPGHARSFKPNVAFRAHHTLPAIVAPLAEMADHPDGVEVLPGRAA